ncbi:hypothetical protein A9308_03830 [Moraxella atlantae]|uniref:5-carboxymethyl-2-hydroxymuconate isomerase n=1 Tax=Faucicola atlantae TaxID=34059 RepID=A0A1B8QFC1_9GAMM|nr:hypothetical protein [Moraxella atlantae]OBX80662.1 hypothetical protein A9308_03830 [Moraxella atlantae]
MPHLIIETSQNLSIPDPERLMQQIHQALFATGQVKALNDLKSRLYQSKHSLVGDGCTAEHFIMVQLYLMAGRDAATIAHLCQVVADTIAQFFATHLPNNDPQKPLQICVNPVELGAQYTKRNVHI